MRRFTNLDNVFILKNKLTLQEAYCLEWMLNLSTWANHIIIKNEVYYFAAKSKACEDIPVLTSKPDTMYRYYKKLSEKGFIKTTKIDGKDYVCLLAKCSFWNQSDYSDDYPNNLGRLSENNSDDYPTYSNINIIDNNTIEKKEIKNFSNSNFSDLKLFDELPDQKQKEKKVAPKKEKIGKEIIFPLVKKLAEYFPESITSKLTANDKKNWCETVEKLLRIDQYTEAEIIKAVKDARSHNFWKDNFLSLTKLRKKKDNITYMQKFSLLNGNEATANDGSGNFQEIQTDESMLT